MVKDKNKNLIAWITAASLLLGVLVQLALSFTGSAERRRNAALACEAMSLEAEERLSELEESGSSYAESLRLNSAGKAERTEELSDLDILMLVNPWNPIPEGYEPELEYINNAAPELYNLNNWEMMDVRAVDALARMLADCYADGNGVYVCSAYRPHEKQVMLYENKISRVIAEGYSYEEAPAVAAMAVAVPGTSEHELGLSADILDLSYPYLNEYQEQTPAQRWLLEHCWDYGFILRFPVEASDITGIIYEPWHYRYVGEKYAAQIHELGITLEEYTALRRGR